MDIRKLQRAIVDGLEDVKGQNIVVFNTEHLSPLFERVIIASGTSNRQTKALAQSVRDAVKGGGMQVMRTEGEDNGEWIIVDCGAAVVHLMQPSIRDYYHLEEIWGDKPVKIKLDTAPVRLVKAEEPAKAAPSKRSSSKAAPSKRAAKPAIEAAPARKPAAKKPAAKKTAAKKVVIKAPATKTMVVGKTAVKRAPAGAKAGVTRTVGVKSSAAKKTVVRKPAAKAAPTRAPARAPTKAPARPAAKAPSKAPAKAPAKKAPARKATGRS